MVRVESPALVAATLSAAATAAAATTATTTTTVTAATAATAAAATVAATAAAAATVAAATAATAGRTLFGFVHAEGTPVEERTVHLGNGLGRIGRVAHGHEREAAGLPGFTIRDDVDIGHLTDGRKMRAHRLGGRAEGQIAHVKPVTHDFSLVARGWDRFEKPPPNEPQGSEGRPAEENFRVLTKATQSQRCRDPEKGERRVSAGNVS